MFDVDSKGFFNCKNMINVYFEYIFLITKKILMLTKTIFFNNKNKIDVDQRNEVAPLSAPPLLEDQGAGYS